MTIMEGVSADDCKSLRDSVGKAQATIEESDEVLEELPVASARSRDFLMSACGIAYYPADDYDPEFTDDDAEEMHATIDKMEDDIVATVPDAIVEDDISFKSEAALENKKRVAVSSASRAKNSLDEFTEDDLDGTDRNPKGPTTVVCKHTDGEKKRECIERRTDDYDDVNWTGVTNSGETI